MELDPINRSYVFNFEKTHNEDAFTDYMKMHWTDSIIYSVVYVIVVFGTQLYMHSRRRFDLRPTLAFWSGLLAVFSIIGAIRTVPELVWSLSHYGFKYSCCNNSFMGQGKITSFWTALFVLSKVLELGDTVFIVLRKQPLIFLHWYHHATVLMYVWYSYPEKIASGRWFMVMNYVVHSFMYTYYFLRAMKYQFPKWVNMCITSMQLLQMVVGILVNVVAYAVLIDGGDCGHNYINIKYCLMMYLSYLVLFAHFFYTTYMMKKPAPEEEKEKRHWYKSCLGFKIIAPYQIIASQMSIPDELTENDKCITAMKSQFVLINSLLFYSWLLVMIERVLNRFPPILCAKVLTCVVISWRCD